MFHLLLTSLLWQNPLWMITSSRSWRIPWWISFPSVLLIHCTTRVPVQLCLLPFAWINSKLRVWKQVRNAFVERRSMKIQPTAKQLYNTKGVQTLHRTQDLYFLYTVNYFMVLSVINFSTVEKDKIFRSNFCFFVRLDFVFEEARWIL